MIIFLAFAISDALIVSTLNLHGCCRSDGPRKLTSFILLFLYADTLPGQYVVTYCQRTSWSVVVTYCQYTLLENHYSSRYERLDFSKRNPVSAVCSECSPWKHEKCANVYTMVSNVKRYFVTGIIALVVRVLL